MDYLPLRALVANSPLAALQPLLTSEFLDTLRHGDFQRWRRLIDAMPGITPSSYSAADQICVGSTDDADNASLIELENCLRELIPWRKGPFSLFGIDIDSEWRSQIKWDRLLPYLSPLQGKTVLDVGSGNGYHCFRMQAEGARLVIGVDSHLPYIGQFWAIKHYLPELPVYVLPVSLEQWPGDEPAFDTVFSMGVLYHSRAPMEHLLQIKRLLRPDGELILESIVVPGDRGYSLTPKDRYARMGNVWFVPSVATMVGWLERCGYINIRVVDESVTTETEQRKTPWMPYDSLDDSLDSDNKSLTIEGYPAPRRAIVIANTPSA